MIIEKSMSPKWLSNCYLVADHPGGHAVLVDSGGPPEPILARIEADSLTLTHLLCTHHHHDHVAHNDLFRRRFGCQVVGHPEERSLFGDLDQEIGGGEELRVGQLHIQALHVPGHTLGQLAFRVGDDHVFTGDTLFRGSIGGTRAPGHTSFEDLHRSIMRVLMQLPPETEVHPGHTDPTTIGREWEENPFIRVWRGIDPPGEERCTAFDALATLVVRARDYDGGSKCWVRFDDGNKDDIVPGSRVQSIGD